MTATDRAMEPDRSIRAASITAGAALLLMSALAIFGYVVAIDGSITPGDAARTAEDIAASSGLFRAGIVSLVVVVVLDVVVGWALFEVFRPVSGAVSLLAAAFRLVYAGVFLVAITHLVEVLRLLGDDGSLAAFDTAQLQVQALLRIEAFEGVWDAGLSLFGVHLCLIGYLAYRSRTVPRAIGLLVVVAGLGYVVDSLGAVLSADAWTEVSSFTFVGEFLLAVWLVVGRRLTRERALA